VYFVALFFSPSSMLRCNNGENVQRTAALTRLSGVAREDSRDIIVNAPSEAVRHVITWCEHYADASTPPDEVWDQAFCAAFTTKVLFEVILAANALRVELLLHVTCKAVAAMVRGKTPEELREHFRLPDEPVQNIGAAGPI